MKFSFVFILACLISLSMAKANSKYVYAMAWFGKTIEDSKKCSLPPDFMTESKMDISSSVCQIYNSDEYQCILLFGYANKRACLDRPNVSILKSGKYALIVSGNTRLFSKSGACVPTNVGSFMYTCGSSFIQYKSCKDGDCKKCSETTEIPFNSAYSCKQF